MFNRARGISRKLAKGKAKKCQVASMPTCVDFHQRRRKGKARVKAHEQRNLDRTIWCEVAWVHQGNPTTIAAEANCGFDREQTEEMLNSPRIRSQATLKRPRYLVRARGTKAQNMPSEQVAETPTCRPEPATQAHGSRGQT